MGHHKLNPLIMMTRKNRNENRRKRNTAHNAEAQPSLPTHNCKARPQWSACRCMCVRVCFLCMMGLTVIICSCSVQLRFSSICRNCHQILQTDSSFLAGSLRCSLQVWDQRNSYKLCQLWAYDQPCVPGRGKSKRQVSSLPRSFFPLFLCPRHVHCPVTLEFHENFKIYTRKKIHTHTHNVEP